MRYRFIVGIALLVILFVIIASCFSKTGPISLEAQNMDIVRLSIYALKDGDWSSFADLHSPGYLQHTPDRKTPVAWPEYELACRIAHNRLPELQYRIMDIFAAGDKVAVRYVWECRKDSMLFKMYYPDGIAQGSEIGIFRIKNGLIIEEWCEYDPADIRMLVIVSRSMEHNK